MAKTYEPILQQTLFEPDRNSDDPNAPNQAMCQVITTLGDWNNTTKSIDSREIVLKKDQEYSIQIYKSDYKTARGRDKYTMRISEVIDDGQGLPVKPAVRRL
jgi:hypothetical protein|tara:strand:- start:1200 stop:1505 length:306 start_codon:yes stop_codon:yes gene_type:complete